MGRISIVLYAEGPRETAGFSVSGGTEYSGWGHRAAGESIPEAELGPGHVLLRRALVELCRIPEGAIEFVEGLRDRRGRVPRGSQLLVRSTLRQILSWAGGARMPDLAVVLVDRDGVGGRREELRGIVGDLHEPPWVIAVAREEFEAWLIADETAVASVLGRSVAPSADPEQLAPGVAKSALTGWLSAEPSAHDPAAIRRSIAEYCKLDVLRSRCPAFGQLLADLAEISCGCG